MKEERRYQQVKANLEICANLMSQPFAATEMSLGQSVVSISDLIAGKTHFQKSAICYKNYTHFKLELQKLD